MIAILKKEIRSFFSSPVGYLVIGLFLIVSGLFLWVFQGDYNLLDNGFADMSAFFYLAPWVFLFLVPALSMRSISEEKKQGTMEMLLTKPVSKIQIVIGKYLGVLSLVILAIIPTLLYVYALHELGNPAGNIDLGSTLGSYIGLVFLVASYAAIGLFASSLTNNQIVAFIIGVFLCFVFYSGFDGLSNMIPGFPLDQLGMDLHYRSVGQGVIDSRDVIYFLSIICIFLALTAAMISPQSNFKRKYKSWIGLLVIVVLLNVLSSSFFKRFDLTEDKRYTLNDATINALNDIDRPLVVDVFLEGEGFPSEFKRLKRETRILLDEFGTYNNLIKFNFINPLEDPELRQQNIQQLTQRGLTPMQLSVQESGRTTQAVIFPWALASYNETTVKIPLIKNKIGANQTEMVNNSVQNIEYAFADGFSKLLYPKRRKIAVLKGNGQLPNRNIADFVSTLRDYYFIAPFTLDRVEQAPQRTLDSLRNFDLIISAKPTEAFSEGEKLVLDQYIMSGGKSLWLVDGVAMDTDSLLNEQGKGIAVPNDLNLTDFFFKYGIRINPQLVNDLYSAPITLASGEGSQAQFNQLPWFYSPLINTESNHPITKNINLVKLDFASPIDTLKNPLEQTILMRSSLLSKIDGVPKEIDLGMATNEPDPEAYSKGPQAVAVLVEGEFTSVYNNRIKPISLTDVKQQGDFTKMIIVSDGNIVKNDVGRNGVLELGFDRWTGELYGNKEFLLNAVNYLLDDTGLINIRSKNITMAFLDQQKVVEQGNKWRIITILLPLVILLFFGWIFHWLRRKKYKV
ncbi:MAG: gliding motility-associated ABC transporter substrate-binding protein GldG [Flavobacteriaceae bacterium]|nr:gliding motility-associated ABC transporter substrate-binding protein GldG [Flavobacteriaceae bacterium]